MKKAPGLRRTAVIFAASTLGIGANAQPLPKMVSECIGSHVLVLPADAEFALNPATNFVSEDFQTKYLFADGTVAQKAAFVPDNEILVSALMTPEEFGQMRDDISRTREKKIQRLQDRGMVQEAKAVKYVEFDVPANFGWNSANGIMVYWYDAGRAYRYFLSKSRTAELAALNSKFSSRRASEKPSPGGLCFPFGVFKGDPPPAYHVAVELRLPSHPDVEILIEERLYPSRANDVATAPPESLARYHVERGSRQNFSSITYEWLPSDKPIAAQRNVRVLAQVKREGNLTDFLYVAAANNSHFNSGVEPYLLVSVSRNQKRAKGKPVNEKFIRDLGERIVSSIQKNR